MASRTLVSATPISAPPARWLCRKLHGTLLGHWALMCVSRHFASLPREFHMTTLRARQVAIVDDDAAVRKALGRLLRAHGIETRTYGSGQDFLEAVPSEEP